MSELVPFRLELSGESSDQHEFQGYDGYMALAGFAWTLALVTNYAETGKIRQRGDFVGRDAVRATAPAAGSIVAEFGVWLSQNPATVLGLGGLSAGTVASAFLYDLVSRVIRRNLGQDDEIQTPLLNELLQVKGGDIEALVAKVEPAIKQTHSVIGNGAAKIKILGGHNILNTYDQKTKEYMSLNYEDDRQLEQEFSVAAFNVNSGYGSVFDFLIGRTVPITMSREVRQRVTSVFTWGLDQYANRTGGKVRVKYYRILAVDGTPKRYIVMGAVRVKPDA